MVIMKTLRELLGVLLHPQQRTFWMFLIASGSIAMAVSLPSARYRVQALRRGLSRDLWACRSALLDYQMLVVKALLRVTLFAPWTVSTFAVAALVLGGLRSGVGAGPAMSASPVLVGVSFTVATFLADDCSRYFVHRLMHRVPALWELHKVHHSATVLTPFTLYRTHPLESFINGTRGAVVIGAVTGLFVWLFGAGVQGWQILGVDAVGFVWTLLGANLRHSHVWLSYGPRLEHLFISPAQHQVHHSSAPRHHDRNFGEILGVWDWLAGSLYVTRREPEPMTFGLSASEMNHHESVVSAVVAPVRAAAARVVAGVRRPLLTVARVALVVAVGLVVSGCAGKNETIDRALLLRTFGECVLTTAQAFELEASELAAATEAAVVDTSARPAAQEAWRRAIDVWQRAEMMQLGPAALPPAPGGQNLREGIYAWPEVNRCLIEQQLVAGSYEGGLAAAPATTRGLASLEYLLFYDGADNACPATANINASGAWAALTADALAARKASYARVAAADVAARARELVASWEPGAGDFLTQLATAGAGSTVYPTQSAALSAVAGGLFYLEIVVEHRKLAPPLGLQDCAAQTCPEALESTWAGRAKQHLANNLVGFRHLAFGCGANEDGLAFDDLLVAAGAESVAAALRDDAAATSDAIDQIAGPSLAVALAQDRDAVQRIYDAAKALADTLKGELTVALEVTVPGRVSGDHD